jgi:putative transposase
MPKPKAQLIVLEPHFQQELENLIRRHSTPQQISLRAKIILMAHQGSSNLKIRQELGVSEEMPRTWRARWKLLEHIPLKDKSVAERLADAPRPGAPATISAEAYCQIMALACQPPEQSGRPISQWTSRELADQAIESAIVKTISPRQVGRFLKRSGS